MTALTVLTDRIVDYAGLFPPAGLPMPAVVANYAAYRESADSGMLARLIIPASRLAEFEQEAAGLLPTVEAVPPWRISGLLPPVDAPGDAFKFAVSGIEQFNERHRNCRDGHAVVDVIEVSAPTSTHIQETAEKLPWYLKAFLEIPHDEDPADLIDGVASLNSLEKGRRFFAKIRTGGVTSDLIPSVPQVARFISACSEHLVGFKATAGLHHPLRGGFRLTYEPDAETATMHGFLNVFVAACFAFAGAEASRVESIVACTDPEEFIVESNGIGFAGMFVSARKIAAIRRQFALSFGSCSFEEPSAELKALPFMSAPTR